MSSDLSREAALKALEKCRRSGAWSSASMDSVITEYKLDGREKALAVNIFLGVLQNMSLCDFYIDSFSKSQKIEPKVRDILRTAVYQLLFMDRIPPSAAVNESVSLCRKLGFSRASGFVNAVLRKIVANLNELPEIDQSDKAQELSIRYSHPKWLAEKLLGEYGYNFTKEFFAANNTETAISIQVNTLKISTYELEKILEEKRFEVKNHPNLKDCLLIKGRVTEMPGFNDGLFYVQDPAARYAVMAAGLKPGMKVLDACAAPGGKSFASAISMGNTGSILSCDLHEKKTRLIKEGADRLGISIISVKAADARAPLSEEYDAVIADVPCSGYGVIRKKPEIRYKSEDERKVLPEIQYDILDNLSNSVRAGGIILYSTCTVFREENEDIIEKFLSKHENFVAQDFELPGMASSTDGMLTLWPHIHGTDGFFVAKLRRLK